MHRYLSFVDALSTWVGKAFGWLILVLTLGVSYEVFVRYVLRAPTTWAFDFSYIMYGAMFLMGGAYTLVRNQHVRADVLYRFWRPRTQAMMDLLLYIIFFLPAVAAWIYAGWPYAKFSFQFREVSIFSPAGIPVFPLKALIPIAGVLLLLQGIAEIIRCLMCIRVRRLAAAPARRGRDRKRDYPRAAASARTRRRLSRAQGDWSMTDPQIGLSMLFLFLFIIMLGFPIAFSLIAMGIGFGFYAYYVPGQEFFNNRIFSLFVQKTFEVLSSDVLTAVPLFLFMGYLVERASILDRLFHSLQISMKNVPGALAVATLLTCAMFATATGIVGAVVTLMGLLAFPAMLRAGYDVKLSAGVVCAGGCLGILIPPSILLIVYAATAGVSAVKLYAAAFLPGFLLTALYIVYVIARAMINPALAPKLPKEQTDIPGLQVLWALVTSFLPLALLIISVLGAILFGLATPSEAAAIGALGSIILAAAYRSLDFQMLKESVYLTVRATSMVCYLFIGSWTFSSVFALLGGQSVVEQFILSLNMSQTGFLLLTQGIIFLLGWPLEWTEIIIIFVPIFLPLLDDFGVNPIFFGILVALNTQTAFNTPPVAMAAFYLKGVAPPHVKLTDIFSGSLPFVFMVFATMALVYTFPQIALWLPDYLYTPR